MTDARPPRGLTLIEFLIATSILAFAALGVAAMFPAALRSVMAGGDITKATLLAQAMSEVVRSEPFDVIEPRYNNFTTQGLPVTCPLDDVATPPPYPDHAKKQWACDLRRTGVQDTGRGLPSPHGTVAVACVDPAGAGGACASTHLRRVTVTVFWEGGARSVSLVTNVARIH